MVAEVCYMDFSRQFHLWKRERSRSYVTDEKGENGRKGRVNNKSNYFKTASKPYASYSVRSKPSRASFRSVQVPHLPQCFSPPL